MADETVSEDPSAISSALKLPYSELSPLNTVDLHFPAASASTPSFWLIYIHGGAFRDPLQDSSTVVPSLRHLFETTSTHEIYGVASLNYRLSPYPSHPTQPSSPDDPSRNAKWPDNLEDVTAGIVWVLENGSKYDNRPTENVPQKRKRSYILAGHSVGGTMALKIAMSEMLPFPYPVAVLSMCGIYDFTALRNAHLSHRQLYEDFTTAAFGPEEEGGWEKGSTRKGTIQAIGVVVLAHSKTDTLVEWEQLNVMSEFLPHSKGPGAKAVVMELQGDHREIYEKGVEMARAIKETIRLLEKIRLD